MQTYIQIMIVVCHAYNTSNNIGYANVLVGGKPFTLPLQSQLLGTIFKFMMMLKVVRIPNTSAIVPFFCILVSTSSKDSSRQTSFVFHLQDTWFQHFFHLFFSLSLMELEIRVCLLLFLFGILSGSQAYTFYVGGKDGWVLYPSENYNHWAERMRFQVSDTLGEQYNFHYK